MATAREDNNEIIRLSRFTLEGENMVDIRFWKQGKTGPRPTKRGIAIKQKMIVRMIIAMQKIHAQVGADEARQEAGVQ